MTTKAATDAKATKIMMPQMPVWLNDTEIDPAWINEKIPSFQKDVVVKCTVQDISNDTRKGAKVKDGATLLLNLSIQNKAESQKTLVIKQVPPSGLQLSRQLGLAREAFFFNHLASRINLTKEEDNHSQPTGSVKAECIPKVYYAQGDMEDGSKIIIMEDLSDSYIDSGIHFGPGNPNNWNRDLPTKIAKAYSSSKPVTTAPTSFEVANETFLAIAQVHAAFWRDKTLLEDKYKWLRGSSWVSGREEISWKASQGLIQGMWQGIQNEIDSKLKWDPLVKKILEKAMKGISWESQLNRLNPSTNWCLVHGDFWPGNVMISIQNVQDLKLLDWEMTGLGSGPQDLGQYVLSNMDPQERRDCEDELVRNYYDKLVQLGIKDFTWEECWREYLIGGLERWLWFLVYFCAQSGPLLDWAQFFHDQIKAFVYDHSIQPEDVTQPRP